MILIYYTKKERDGTEQSEKEDKNSIAKRGNEERAILDKNALWAASAT